MKKNFRFYDNRQKYLLFVTTTNEKEQIADAIRPHVKKIKPQIISTGNIGCITQILQSTKIPILHTVEIIDWYTGGPKPDILKKL